MADLISGIRCWGWNMSAWPVRVGGSAGGSTQLGQDSESARSWAPFPLRASVTAFFYRRQKTRHFERCMRGDRTGRLCGALIRNTWLNFLRGNSQLLSLWGDKKSGARRSRETQRRLELKRDEMERVKKKKKKEKRKGERKQTGRGDGGVGGERGAIKEGASVPAWAAGLRAPCWDGSASTAPHCLRLHLRPSACLLPFPICVSLSHLDFYHRGNWATHLLEEVEEAVVVVAYIAAECGFTAALLPLIASFWSTKDTPKDGLCLPEKSSSFVVLPVCLSRSLLIASLVSCRC